jgi:hypothetical protein
VFAGSSADFGKFIADEIEKWRKVVRFAHQGGIITWFTAYCPIATLAWTSGAMTAALQWMKSALVLRRL